MDIPAEDIHRLMTLEQTRENAMEEYVKNPTNAENLTKLGRCLVELSQFAQGADSTGMLDMAVQRLEDAVRVDPSRHEAHWWLGNAHTTHGFQTSDSSRAGVCFDKAAEAFRNAIKEDPTNEAYKKSLEVSLKGPELHQELQKQMALQQALNESLQGGGGPGGPPPGAQAAKKKKTSDFWYDAAGWVILTVGVVAWLSILSARAPPPTSAAK